MYFVYLAVANFAILTWAIGAQPFQGRNDLDSTQDGKQPTFLTLGQTFRIAIGSTVVLPCRVQPPGVVVQVWKRGIAVLTAGPVMVTPDKRVRLLTSPVSTSTLAEIPGLSAGGGYSLELKDVRPQDAGDYVCQIGTIEPQEITHTLEILVPPRIHYVSHTAPLEVLQGATVKMECRASGNPVPTVSWTRKNNVLPSGERSVSGLSMVIQHADRHSAGQYQCSADNGVGEPDTRHITLNVLYGPEVETESGGSVHTGLGQEAQLSCIVHAEPNPQVLWFKDTAQLGTTERHETGARGNRYTLIIRNVTSTDFGNYSCAASNNHGKGRAHLTLTGAAAAPRFESPPLGSDKDSYNISWSVNSYSPIAEYRLSYRQTPRHHHAHHQATSDTFNASGTKMNYRIEWHNVAIPGNAVHSSVHSYNYGSFSNINNNNNNIGYKPQQHMSYVIKGLQPATSYEARVQVKNQHGWNKYSPNFHFTTRSNDMENMVEPSAQPAVYGVSQQGMSPFSSGVRKQLNSAIYPLVLLLALFF